MRRNAWQLLLLVLLVFAPGVAYAQSSITGVVRDTSGAVLPGVTVEASSDVLIEKVRTAVTDSSGVYRIVDLRPGSYAVSFTLPGFKTYKRDGLVLASEFTATVNAEINRVAKMMTNVFLLGLMLLSLFMMMIPFLEAAYLLGYTLMLSK